MYLFELYGNNCLVSPLRKKFAIPIQTWIMYSTITIARYITPYNVIEPMITSIKIICESTIIFHLWHSIFPGSIISWLAKNVSNWQQFRLFFFVSTFLLCRVLTEFSTISVSVHRETVNCRFYWYDTVCDAKQQTAIIFA